MNAPQKFHPVQARETYIRTADDIDGIPVTNALTGRVAINSAVFGEPLCGGCDAPVWDGPCWCEIPAEAGLERAAA